MKLEGYEDRLLTKLRRAVTPVYGGSIDHAALAVFRDALTRVKQTYMGELAGPAWLCSLWVPGTKTSWGQFDLWVSKYPVK